MAKQKTINRDYKTVLFDFDGTLFNTAEADQYVARQKTLRRFSPEWVQARKEYLEHIKMCTLYDGWQQVFEYIKVNNIQAAIVSGNNREVLNHTWYSKGVGMVRHDTYINGKLDTSETLVQIK